MTAYDTGLDRNDANFVALSPLSFLARTARVYEDATTLIDPPSGRRFPTILPRDVVVPPEELTPVPAATPAATDSAPLLTPPLLPVPPR